MKQIILIVAILLCGNTFAQNYSGGSGTLAAPYKIANKSDLKYLSENSGEWSKHFIQTENILFDSADFELNGDFYNSGNGFKTIGDGNNDFTGTYNGDNNIIDGTKIYRLSSNFVGVFGRASSATIKNLGVTNCVVSGKSEVGGLVGTGRDSTIVIGCYSSGKVSATDFNAGGLIGSYEKGTVRNSYSTASVSCDGINTGGLMGGFIGRGTGTVKNCFATGDVDGHNQAGGLIGECSLLDIEKSYATGKVTGTYGIGAFIGTIGNTSTVTNCFWDTVSSTLNKSTGSGHINANSEATGKSTSEMQMLSTFTNAGWDFVNETTNGTDDIWQVVSSGCLSGIGYPIFEYINTETPNITSTSGATICTNNKTTLKANSNVKLLDWYITKSGNVIAGRGISFTTPTLNSTTSYWVEAKNGSCSTTRVEVVATVNQPTTSTISPTACFSYTSPSGKVWAVSNTYTDTIANTANCDSIITINLTIDTVNNSITVVSKDTLMANAVGATYQWLDCGNGNQPIAGETNQHFAATANGNYAVIVTENNCTDTSTCVALTSVGINTNILKQAVSIYPNPSKGKVNVDLGSITNASIEVYNAYGQLIFQNKGVNNNYHFALNGATGLYIIKVSVNGKEAHFRLIKE